MFDSVAIKKIYKLRDLKFDEYNAFINARINLKDILNIFQNIGEVTCDHALLNYSIQMGYSIDVGKLNFFISYVHH
ncbi:hypothetical protein IEQ34_007455 [Dendrobium chrysotoxum]|uniref:Uncharacterized protein n=1 Tax=Dendrobium chrysotoxum TaxID=161865 RepID=A0AAV7H5E3_DENCH|nr:hypothetical protein IEQ34_007455 [Dendrobium chrysotoxum]